jgi:hypothetical protein
MLQRINETKNTIMKQDKKELLGQIMRHLANNEDEQADKLIKIFMDYVPEISAEEVTETAQKLDDEGVFADAGQHIKIERKVFTLIDQKIPVQDLNVFPEGHPIHTFLTENKVIKETAERAKVLLDDESSFQQLFSDWLLIAKQFLSLDIHYLRKENQLFPFLERRGFSHPSTIMWSLHDEIRRLAKAYQVALNEKNETQAREMLSLLRREASEMTVKEEKVLLPRSSKLLTEADWFEIRQGEDEIGYCLIDTPPAWNPNWKHPSDTGEPTSQSIQAEPVPFTQSQKQSSLVGGINLEEGSITPEQINLIFKHLPFDVTYVDENDEVRYYNKGEDRVFPRSPGIIGRQVKYCHPPKSVHIVEKIVAAFKSGEKSEANFWINFKEKFIYIQYFAVRDDGGNYKGVIEITYDAKTVRSLEGEQRLLDWE